MALTWHCSRLATARSRDIGLRREALRPPMKYKYLSYATHQPIPPLPSTTSSMSTFLPPLWILAFRNSGSHPPSASVSHFNPRLFPLLCPLFLEAVRQIRRHPPRFLLVFPMLSVREELDCGFSHGRFQVRNIANTFQVWHLLFRRRGSYYGTQYPVTQLLRAPYRCTNDYWTSSSCCQLISSGLPSVIVDKG